MPSRRRSRTKNLGTNLADVQRRMRYLERRPARTKLQRKVITAVNIAPEAVGPDEVNFGTNIVTTEDPTTILNPKEGQIVVNPENETTSIYSADAGEYVPFPSVDAVARASADGKNTIYRQSSEPTGGTYVTGDTWFDTDDNNKIYRYDSAYVPVAPATSKWVALVLGGNALANISANSINTGTLNANQITVANLDVGSMTTGTLNATRIVGGEINGITINATNGGKIGAWDIGPTTVIDSGTYAAIKTTDGDVVIGYNVDTGSQDVTGRPASVLSLTSPGGGLSFGVGAIGSSSITSSFNLESTSGSIVTETQDVGGMHPTLMTLTSETVAISGDFTVSGSFSITSTANDINGLKNISATTSTGTPSGGVDGDIVLVYV
jgi:hypothetical protein